MNRLSNKICMVTGAASGIGQACAMRMVEEGAYVIITDINATAGNALAEKIGKSSIFISLDVSDEKNWIEVMKTIKHQYGRLDIMVNNAGITGSPLGPQDPEHLSLENWHKVHAVNLDGVFLGCKYAIQMMKELGGVIINISSRSGLVGVPYLSAYASSKAAIRNHTKSVALYCASKNYNIRCNSIHPATIMTPLWDELLGETNKEKKIKEMEKEIPLQQFGKPDDVAYGVIYLASDEARYITGAELVIDGGILAGSAATPK